MDVPSNKSMLGMSSIIRQEHHDLFNKAVSNQLTAIDNYLASTKQNSFDPNGHKILNASKENIWFKDYVAFIFSTGCVFNMDDKAQCDEVLKLFEVEQDRATLYNFVKVMNYEEPLIKAIEERVELGNGNYHMCLITMVNTTDPKILAQAPEDKYKVSGIIDKYCDWNSIFTFMKDAIIKYGLLSNIQPTISPEQTFETPRSANINNYDELTHEMGENHELVRDFINYRETYLNSVRPEVYANKGSNRNVHEYKDNKPSLYKRMYNNNTSGVANVHIPPTTKGIESKYEMYSPETAVRLRKEAERKGKTKEELNTIGGFQDEFIMYDERSYENGKNVWVDVDDEVKGNIPSFGLIKRGKR